MQSIYTFVGMSICVYRMLYCVVYGLKSVVSCLVTSRGVTLWCSFAEFSVVVWYRVVLLCNGVVVMCCVTLRHVRCVALRHGMNRVWHVSGAL